MYKRFDIHSLMDVMTNCMRLMLIASLPHGIIYCVIDFAFFRYLLYLSSKD